MTKTPLMRTMLSRRPGGGELTTDGVTWVIDPPRPGPPRTVSFPKNRVLGELFAETYPATGRSLSQMKRLGPARGDVDVPAGHRLILHVEERITGHGLKALAKVAPRALQSLLLGGAGLTDAGLRHLRKLTWLEHLDVSCNRITGEGLTHLGGMLLLERLELWGCELTEEGMANLPPLPSLRHLSLALHLELQDDALARLDQLPVLESLDLHSTPVSDEAVAHLRKLRSLRSLHVSNTKITSNGVAELRSALTLCRMS